MGPPNREPLLRRIVEALRADRRVAAAWLMGSIGRGEDDAWSDLDLHIAVHDGVLADFWSERFGLYSRVGRPVLIQREIPSNAQPGGHFQLVIFDGPLEVDWNLGPLSLAERSRWHVPLVERADIRLVEPEPLSHDERRDICQERLIFAWAMAPIGIKYIARGQTRRAVGLIGMITDAYISLWRLVEMGYTTRGGLNQPPEPGLVKMLPQLEANIDPQACLAVMLKLCARLTDLHPRLSQLGVAIPDEMPGQLARLTANLR